MTWICVQLGAREHYAIPRALAQQNMLNCLITDAWIKPTSWINHLPHQLLRTLRDRYDPDLANSAIASFTPSLIQFELSRIKTKGWNKIIERNQWFMSKVLSQLKKLTISSPPILFSYSYTANSLFRYAKQQGWITVLGQIDPGIVEEQLLSQVYPEYQDTWEKAPDQYWNDWKIECELADYIVVNSEWSSQALKKRGIASDKLKIIPLVYQPPIETQGWVKTYPGKFSVTRPLRVLFLGQIILRKGIIPLLKAAKMLESLAIEFYLVGRWGMKQIQFDLGDNIITVGSVPRSLTAKYYQMADIFIFPTLSDGFGLTQLEAQRWKLPIISSKYCGQVVEHNRTGLILEEVAPEPIAEALLFCFNNPEQLAQWSQKTQSKSIFQIADLSHYLANIINHV